MIVRVDYLSGRIYEVMDSGGGRGSKPIIG